MTIDDIIAGIDRNLHAITAERERLLLARTQLQGGSAPVAATESRKESSSSPRSTRTVGRVLEALHVTEARTAGDIATLTKVGRANVGSTLTRLVKQGKATKAERGYLRVGN